MNLDIVRNYVFHKSNLVKHNKSSFRKIQKSRHGKGQGRERIKLKREWQREALGAAQCSQSIVRYLPQSALLRLSTFPLLDPLQITELYQFEQLVPAAVMLKAGAWGAKARTERMSVSGYVIWYDNISNRKKKAVQWGLCLKQKHKSEPLHMQYLKYQWPSWQKLP